MTTGLVARADGFDLLLAGQVLIAHRADAPCFSAGHGDPLVAMHRGNFALEDQVEERVQLRHAVVDGSRIILRTHAAGEPLLVIDTTVSGTDMVLAVQGQHSGLNRLWFHLAAEPDEHVWGAGEQMSYLDLRGRRFPLWTSEPGVGRDKSTAITWQADVAGHAGGDYWTTNYPQPTFLSSRRYALHLDTIAYACLDFRRPDRHRVEVWEIPARIELWSRPDLPSLVGAMGDRFGRPPPLPDWVYAGAIIGLKDGERSFARLDAMLEAGVRVSGLWCEDWVGLRHTSGARLFWDWRADERRYPDLRSRIADLRARGIRFLGYVNPYLCDDGTLFAEAEAAGHLATDAAGGTGRVDFGEFTCGVVDFTSPGAADWFAERVIGQNMLDAGLSGWMADFGEYLPTDIRLAAGDPMLLHNAWPALWAAVNARAVASRGMAGEALFFMRAGWTGVQAHCPLLWGGDQSVDWTRHDGLPSAICGALSAGLLGNALHHSDIGGYTSLFGNVRTPELIMRWAEMAAFTPVMRTHEGNRPRDNLQIDGDPVVLAHFAAMTRLWVHLVPYLRAVVAEIATAGLPVQRPLFLHFETDPRCAAIQDCYLYGPDLLVAPVLEPGATTRTTYLPAGTGWTHLWSGQHFAGGAEATVPAPLGQPPAFIRDQSPHRSPVRSGPRSRSAGMTPCGQAERLPGRGDRRIHPVRLPPCDRRRSVCPSRAAPYRPRTLAGGAPTMTTPLPASWPHGRTLAISVSVMLEGWSEGAAPGVGPMGNVLKAGTLDLQGRSWAEYGAKAGAWRLLEVLAAQQVTAVFYVSGVLAGQYPELMRSIVGAGHKLAAHGWSQHVIPATQTEVEERADLDRCLAALRAASGTDPRGWISPRCTPSVHTTALLRAAGLAWHSDFFDEDLPRVVQTPAGPITAVPFTMEVNDMPLSVRYGNEPEAYTRTLHRILEGWAELPPRPACLDITVHAHVYGRPMGAIEFGRSLRLAAEAPAAFLTEHDALGCMFAA